MAKHTIEELDRGQLDLMWNFLKMGNGKPNIAALKENLDALRQLMIQKTAGQETYRKSHEIQYEDLGTIINCIVTASFTSCGSLGLYGFPVSTSPSSDITKSGQLVTLSTRSSTFP